MPHYMTLYHYTPEAVQALKGTGEDRSQPLRDLMDQAGGRLENFYYCFGEYDGVFIFEAPDDVTAQAIIWAFVAAGHISHERTINLHTVEEKKQVLEKSGDFHYAPPQH